MKMPPFGPQPPQRPGLQERLQQVIGAQVIQIVSLQARVEELEASLRDQTDAPANAVRTSE